jgi:hypothetical protein
LEYLDAVGVVNLLDGISFHCTATMGDGQKQQMLKNFIAELLRDHRGPAEYLPNSIINTYIALYNLIKYNVVFIEQYRCLVQNILGENIYNNEHN